MISPFPDPSLPSSARKAHHRSTPFPFPNCSTSSGQVLVRRLHEELFIWLTTVDEQGIPHSFPVPFVWDEARGFQLIYSGPEADRNRLVHIRHNPNVGLHFDLQSADAQAVIDTIVLTGEATVGADDPPSDQVVAWVGKYREFLSRLGMTLHQAAGGLPGCHTRSSRDDGGQFIWLSEPIWLYPSRSSIDHINQRCTHLSSN